MGEIATGAMHERFDKLLPAVLKEYESLRKEIEARTDATRTYGWPVVVLVGGVVAGWKTGFVLDVVLVFVPVVGMTIAALAANANYTIDRTRVALAHAEQRVNDLAGTVVMEEELRQVRGWGARDDRWLALAWVATLAYSILELFLLWNLSPGSTAWSLNRGIVAVLVIAAPAVIYMYNSIVRFNLRQKPRSWAKP